MNVSPLIQFLAEVLVRQQLGDPNESNGHDAKDTASRYLRAILDRQAARYFGGGPIQGLSPAS